MVYRRTGEAGEKGSKTRLNCTIPSCGDVCIRVLEGTMACHTSCFYFFGCPKLERQRQNDFLFEFLKTRICTKRKPLVRKEVENANRLAEMRSTRAQHHGARNRHRSLEKTRKMRTVGQKFSPRRPSEAQNADRSSEMRPKTRTVGRKRSYGLNAN